ncbi:MAG: group III truncated hemoglobin [Flavobacteriia bacterium]|nr:group III truncated hemoglobin [Flavobacteriia bacterium]
MEAESKLTDILTRADLKFLVSTFYDVIKLDEMLGPIFLRIIPDDKWESHIEKLTDFWGTHLFGTLDFKGNPVLAHQNVDKKLDYSIGQEHFTHWLELWFATVDSLFRGEKALLAKQRAQNMAVGQFLKVWEVKPAK